LREKERENARESAMKLISGGQSGVDRAVLDIAVERGIDYGGWCPKGGWAEDVPKPPGVLARYPKLKETPLADPAQRTEWNVRDADACMIVVDAGGLAVSAGTALAQDLAHRHRKPVFTADLGNAESLKHAALWLRVQKARHPDMLQLAIGGPRESEAPGIYERATLFLRALLD
jgi:Circularly permutated YpsA SLOG family